MKSSFSLPSLSLLLALAVFRLDAQTPPPRPQLDVQAEKFSFDATSNEVTVSGNVVITKDLRSLRADVITYNTLTEQARASGNVVFVNEGQVWEGEVLNYNFITGKGDFPGLVMQFNPFRLKAENAERISPVHLRMENITLTTCETLDDPEFKIRASSVEIFEDRIFVLRNARFFLRGVPFFYFPTLALDQERDATNIDMVPGYSSKEGVFLLTAFNRYPSEGYQTRTHVDLRSERGIAVGQDWIWSDPRNPSERTEIVTYYANDQSPYRNDAEEERLNAQGIEIDEDRYRIRFNHRSNLGPSDSLRVRASYLSDARIVQDFFRKEFRTEPVPETRATYSTIGNGWTANLDVARQLNDDEFNAVNRMPEGSFLMPTRPLGDNGFLVQSEVRGGYLERNYNRFERETNGLENVEAMRFHTANRIFYPTNFFGWLNVVPRTGFAFTHYSETLEDETRITPVSTTDPDTGIITTTFETNTVRRAGSAEGRFLPEIGFETSFKAFGILNDNPNALGTGLRHAVEPFLNYTLIPEPDLRPDRIYQFDAIDRLDEAHNVRMGVRNKFQTRRRLANGGHRIHDLLNIGVSTTYDFRDEVDRNLRNVLLDTELQVVNWMALRFDTEYNTDDSEFEIFNSEVKFINPATQNSLSLDQRYVVDSRHTVQLSYVLNPRGKMGLEGYTRFELEDDGLEEQEILFRFETDCVGYGLGLRWTAGDQNPLGEDGEDDYRVWLQFWLTAFPRGVLNLGGR